MFCWPVFNHLNNKHRTCPWPHVNLGKPNTYTFPKLMPPKNRMNWLTAAVILTYPEIYILDRYWTPRTDCAFEWTAVPHRGWCDSRGSGPLWSGRSPLEAHGGCRCEWAEALTRFIDCLIIEIYDLCTPSSRPSRIDSQGRKPSTAEITSFPHHGQSVNHPTLPFEDWPLFFPGRPELPRWKRGEGFHRPSPPEPSDLRQVIPECESMPPGCNQMKWPWAVGSEPIVFPAEAPREDVSGGVFRRPAVPRLVRCRKRAVGGLPGLAPGDPGWTAETCSW